MNIDITNGIGLFVKVNNAMLDIKNILLPIKYNQRSTNMCFKSLKKEVVKLTTSYYIILHIANRVLNLYVIF